MAPHVWISCLVGLLAPCVLASVRNRTIDDADRSITYSPQWKTACDYPYPWSQCPDPIKIKNGTLHWVWVGQTPDQSDPPQISVQFTGTAVYVYNVLPYNPSPQPDIQFILDNNTVSNYTQPAISSWGYTYNSLVYANSGLQNVPHSLVIEAKGLSLVMFDYFEYTADDDTSSPLPPSLPSSSSSSHKSLSSITSISSQPQSEPGGSLSLDSGTPTSSASRVPTVPGSPPTSSGAHGSARPESIAGEVLGSVLALAVLTGAALYINRHLRRRANKKALRRLADDDGLPRMIDSSGHVCQEVPIICAPRFPIRPTPDVPHSPRPTMSSVATSPTSYNNVAPSKTYLNDGIMASILEKVEVSRSEYPTFTPIERGLEKDSSQVRPHDGSQ
ncbi:hypothetical protein DICSQDRAFT_123728 [Dichomitus squalens LYAD-421 SS1]|uniref:uncharacterized protein n=1 Tax=Dichomitus squalens (strain LYAD-421) TaxID=732165 RepID=UPI0004415375|nr:uncharacterized protein DICSQDRAFT_123728 [Dichomitus squalens LYAD-421 SS1]EJF67358.1 hypothetical protein DICSQDRAFT_123728 [Dichomitus squalens LYAD-421 SS1]